jgi:hypothetical protein
MQTLGRRERRGSVLAAHDPKDLAVRRCGPPASLQFALVETRNPSSR